MANIGWPLLLSLSLSLPLAPRLAEAGKDRGGGDGGGGRLGQVSSGLGQATGGGGRSSGGNTQAGTDRCELELRHYYPEAGAPISLADGSVTATQPAPQRPVKVDFYAGAQKVHDSDGSLSIELAFNEGRFRLGGSLSRYFERQQGADALTLTLPALYLGLRIDDGGPTRAYLEAGAIGARTRNDPVMDSSIGGLLGGVRVEHQLTRRLAAVGDAQVMAFEHEVRGAAVRAGVRLGHLQATVRYFDLNVGPALVGPEVGVRF